MIRKSGYRFSEKIMLKQNGSGSKGAINLCSLLVGICSCTSFEVFEPRLGLCFHIRKPNNFCPEIGMSGQKGSGIARRQLAKIRRVNSMHGHHNSRIAGLVVPSN
jgi:hypothetical protein